MRSNGTLPIPMNSGPVGTIEIPGPVASTVALARLAAARVMRTRSPLRSVTYAVFSSAATAMSSGLVYPVPSTR